MTTILFIALRRVCVSAALCAAFITVVSAQPRRLYEYDYVPLKEFSGGQVLLGGNIGANGAPLFFQFKQKPYGFGTVEADVASAWYGAVQNNVRRTTLGGASVIDAVILSVNSAAVLMQRDSAWILAEVGADLRIWREVSLPVRLQRETDERTTMFTVGNGRSVVVVVNGILLQCDMAETGKITATPLTQDNVAAAIPLNDYTRSADDPSFVYLVQSGLQQIITTVNERGTTLFAQRLDKPQRTVLRRVSNYAVAACMEVGPSSLVTILAKSGTWRDVRVPAKPEHIIIEQLSAPEQPADAMRLGSFAIYYIGAEFGKYSWNTLAIQPNGSASRPEMLLELPENFYLPIAVLKHQSSVFLLFANVLATLDTQKGTLLSVNPLTLPSALVSGTVSESGITLQSVQKDNLFILSLNRTHLLFQRQTHRFWWIRNIISDWWIYGLAFSITTIAFVLLYLFRQQRRLLVTLFELPGADALITLDAEGKLQTLNDTARKLLSMPNDVPMKRLFQFYCVGIDSRALEEFAIEALQARASMTRKIVFSRFGSGNTVPSAVAEQSGNTDDYVFSAHPIQSRYGVIKGVMLIGKDITEELEKKRLVNWAQLAHDMQTNLSIIKLNAEEVSSDHADENSPGHRIMFQVNLLIKRVRDLIAIGNSDDLKKSQADSADLCLNVRREFDASLFPLVEFTVHAQHVLFECDRLKLERALRNAVENGIRAMPNNTGSIRIGCWADSTHMYFEVKDSGEGMTEEVMKSMMKPGFSTFQGKGGSGMGTMIMRHIIQLHGGEMVVTSERSKGTSVQFRLPAKGAKKLTLKPLEFSGKEFLHH